MKKLLLVSVIASLFLVACGGDEVRPGKTPLAAAGPGSGLIEVPSGVEPDSPYWLGPPRPGAYLFIEEPVPGQGRLVYAQPEDAEAIDSGREPFGSLQVSVSITPESQITFLRKQADKALKASKFVRTSPLGPAYIATSGRQARIPVENYKRVIIIKARDNYLLDNAISLVQATGQK